MTQWHKQLLEQLAYFQTWYNGGGRGRIGRGTEGVETGQGRGNNRDAYESRAESSVNGMSASSANLIVVGAGRIVELCGGSVGCADSSVSDDMG